MSKKASGDNAARKNKTTLHFNAENFFYYQS